MFLLIYSVLNNGNHIVEFLSLFENTLYVFLLFIQGLFVAGPRTWQLERALPTDIKLTDSRINFLKNSKKTRFLNSAITPLYIIIALLHYCYISVRHLISYHNDDDFNIHCRHSAKIM